MFDNKERELYRGTLRQEVKERSDKLMNYFLSTYFVLGLVFAYFYDTWFIAFGIGSLSLIAYYSTKIALPKSNLYQYVLSVVLGVFMAQYIYQMHGLFEMHFVAFIGSAILVTYQNWKLQIPMLIVVGIHHAGFGYLQNLGFDNIYFTQLDTLELRTFVIHIILASAIFFICGLWAYQLKKYSELQIEQTLEMAKLQKEALLSIERKRNEEALEKSNSELLKSNTELDKFVYSVSHDLRAPLTSMLGVIEITEDGTEDRFMLKNLNMLKASIHKLDGFIADILSYSRNARQEVVREEIDIREMINDTMNNLKYMSSRKRLVEMNVEVSGNAVVADKRRLGIVINNLLSNAIRYQNPTVDAPFINIKVDSNDKGTLIEIKDNGIGIKKEAHEKIFDMFYRCSKSSEGSGLGLYIVKETIEKLHGRIEVDSELGIGTTFNIYIPNNPTSQLLKKRHVQESYGY
jgi:signal transduction histidine kinase